MLFYDYKGQPNGQEHADREHWQLIYSARDGSPSRPPSRTIEFAERPLFGTERICLPESCEGLHPVALLDDDELFDAYEDLRDELGLWKRHQLGGYAHWQQHDGREIAASARADVSDEPNDWELLWQIASTDEMSWGDAGNLYVLMRKEDLAASRFERSWVGWLA